MGGTPAESVEERDRRLLELAVTEGLALSETEALVGDGPGTAIVDLPSGRARAMRQAGPTGSRCTVLSLADEGLLSCIVLGPKLKTLVISHALGASPRIEKSFDEARPVKTASPLLVLGQTCSGTILPWTACARRGTGDWVDIDARSAVASLHRDTYDSWWTAGEDGRVLVLVSTRISDKDPERMATLDPKAGSAVLWDRPVSLPWCHPADELCVAPRPSGDGTLHGFSWQRVFTVDPAGHVSEIGPSFASIASAGPNALARDSARGLWQTTDWGAHWVEVARPPYDVEDPPIADDGFWMEWGRLIRCSLVGCAIAHPSGTGDWLRLGWPAPHAGSSPPPH